MARKKQEPFNFLEAMLLRGALVDKAYGGVLDYSISRSF
jgi:hypothetical protein